MGPLVARTSARTAIETLLRGAGATSVTETVADGLTVSGPISESCVRAAQDLMTTLQTEADIREEMTEALISAQDRLLALYRLTGLQVGSLDHEEAVQQILAEALQLTESDASVMMDGSVVLRSGDWAAGDALVERIRLSGGRRTQIFHDDHGVAVVTPVPIGGDWTVCLGLARAQGAPYRTGDLKLIEAVGAVLGGVIQMTRLHRLGVERASIEREHQFVSSLAQAVLESPPPVEGAQVLARSIPAQDAGGDFFAFTVRDEVLWYAVGDVAGKGLPAALVMTKVVSSVRNGFLANVAEDPVGVLTQTNNELFDYLSRVGLFVTIVIGSYQPASGQVRLCNAGHSPVIVVSGGVASAVGTTAPPLGIVPHLRGDTCHRVLNDGDLLVIGSDGMVEQQSPDGRMYGYQRFQEDLLASSGLAVEGIMETMFNKVIAHAGGMLPDDDRTMAVLRRGAAHDAYTAAVMGEPA